MNRLDFFEDYFLNLYRKFGISCLKYHENRLVLDEKCIRNMVFASDDFNADYTTLQYYFKCVYEKLKRGFSLKIKQDMNDNCYVFLK